MSEERFPSREVAWVEAELFNLLQDRGMEDSNTINWAMTDLLVNPKMGIETPAVSELPDIYEESVREGLHTLNDLYPGVFPKDELAELEEEILGIIGLGLEGKVPGPMTAPSEVDVAGRDDPPHWAAKNLPETPFDPPEWWEDDNEETDRLEIEQGLEDLPHPERPPNPETSAGPDVMDAVQETALSARDASESRSDAESSEREGTDETLKAQISELTEEFETHDVVVELVNVWLQEIDVTAGSGNRDEVVQLAKYLEGQVERAESNGAEAGGTDHDQPDQTTE